MRSYAQAPRSISEAPQQASFATGYGNVNPFVTAASHAAVPYPTAGAGMGQWGGLPTRASMPAQQMPSTTSFPAVSPFAPSLGGPQLGGADTPGMPPNFGRSTSHAIAPPSLSQFQFKFEPTPEPGPSSARDRGLSPGLATPSAVAAAPTPQPAAAGPAQLPEEQPAPAARGREGVLQRLKSPNFGVSQDPVGSTLQLDACVARCRKEVQDIAAKCRARGEKYRDPDFPADERALYANGREPATGLGGRDMSVTWRRASEGAFANAATPAPGGRDAPLPGSPGPSSSETLVPGALSGTYLLGSLAAMRTVGKEPRELIVWREPEAGVYGVRLFKDGEWMYEILDDELPLDSRGQPLCSRADAGGESQDWPALVEKAYAKVHGSYEAVAHGSEAEALEDVLGIGANHIDVSSFPIWGELWQHLRGKRKRGYLQLAVRRGREQAGEILTSGLISGYGYPVTRMEVVDGEMIVELENPWPNGRWMGRWGENSPEVLSRRWHATLNPRPDSCRPFWMSIQDFCKHFTNIAEARLVPAFWQSCAVTCSDDRPSYPLVSVSSPTQAIFVLTQEDRRWSEKDQYANAIGLRIYRCRIMALPPNTTGARQNVSSPFRNLELLAEKPPAKVRSVVIELPRLEANCLYIAAVDSESRCRCANLRVLTASAPRFRELSAPESSYFLQAQTTATAAVDSDSFSSQGSMDNNVNGASMPMRADPMKGEKDGEGWHDWGTEDEGDVIKLPPFLQACMTSCSGEC